MAITLISNISQANNGEFWLVDSNAIYGGLYHVDTLDEMNLLPSIRLKEGMLCYVAGTVNKFYQYLNSAWTIWKVGFDTAETFTELDNKTIIDSIKANASSITQVDTDYKAAVKSLQDQIDAITGTSEGGDATTIEGLNAQLSALKNLIGKEAEGDNEATGLIKDLRTAESTLATLKITVGDSESGLIKQVNTNTTNISTNTNDISVLKGTGEGSVAKALADAKSYADTKTASLVDSAPETLDTLNELAAALGDDPNFATTVATNIGKKANQTDMNAVQDKLADITGTVKNYVDGQDNAISTRVTSLETSLATGGAMDTRVSDLESSMAIINGDKSTEGSMAKLKSDLTTTIATSINSLSLSITPGETAYNFKLSLGETAITSADLNIETVTDDEINAILDGLS